MKPSDRQAMIAKILEDLAPLTDTRWINRLRNWAAKGFPTGTGQNTSSGGINRPTERFALAPDTPPAQKLKALERLEHELSELAREYHSIYQWTVTAAKYDGPEPVPCRVLTCTNEISNIGSDVPRNGRCPRCAKHWSRYQLEYPAKPTRGDTVKDESVA